MTNVEKTSRGGEENSPPMSSELQQVLDKLNTLSSNFLEIKEEIKSIRKEVTEIKTSQAVLVNDGKWIKILYGVFSSIIILLMGTLINIKS
jgi:archaellum component FlaC